MNDDLWIVVTNWHKFQHYQNRHVPWIKVYTELNSRDDWRQLTYGQRGMLVSIWLEYERSRGQLRASTVPQRCGHRDSHGTLQALIQAGWIELSSRPLAQARREVLRTSKESASAAEPASGAALALEEKARQVAAGWNGGSSDEFDEQLDELERELHHRIPYVLRETLWEQALNRVNP